MLRHSVQITVCIVAASLLLACSSPPPESPLDPSADLAPRTPTVLDEQLKALDTARSVEDTLQKEQADRDKAIDEASGG